MFASSILLLLSRQAAPAADCYRPRNAEDAALCGQILQDAPFTDCDMYAAGMAAPGGKPVGVPFDKIDATLAVPACESAVRQYPTNVRLIFQLGRAYSKLLRAAK